MIRRLIAIVEWLRRRVRVGSRGSVRGVRHCDDYIRDPSAPHCLRFFLLIHRLPAVDQVLCREFEAWPRLYARHDGGRVRVVMASRMGDVGITSDLESETYQRRVAVSDLDEFGVEA